VASPIARNCYMDTSRPKEPSSESIQASESIETGPKRKIQQKVSSTSLDMSKKIKIVETAAEYMELDPSLPEIAGDTRSSQTEISSSPSIHPDGNVSGNRICSHTSTLSSWSSSWSFGSRTLFETPSISNEQLSTVLQEQGNNTCSLDSKSTSFSDEGLPHTDASQDGFTLSDVSCLQQGTRHLSSPMHPENQPAELQSEIRSPNSKFNPQIFEPYRFPQVAITQATSRQGSTQENLTTLVIDVADSTKIYAENEIATIRKAADFLFACGLREDAFPLYLLVWKQLKQQPAYDSGCETFVETFVQCIRSVCSADHCIIMASLIRDRLKQNTDGSKACSRAEYCLFHLVLARIASVTDDEEKVALHLKVASGNLVSLDGIFYDFAATTGTSADDKSKSSRLVTAAIIEEVTLVTQSSSFQKNPTSEPIKSVINQKNPSALALILKPEKHRRVLNRPSGERVKRYINMFLREWMANFLGESHIRLENSNIISGINAELAVFCHLWLEWEEPLWTTPAACEAREHFRSIVTLDLLVVMSSLLVHHVDGPTPAKQVRSLVDVLPDANERLSQLLAMSPDTPSGPSLLDHIRQRYIRILSRRSLTVVEPSPGTRNILRDFLQISLDIVLPAMSGHPSQPEAGVWAPQAIFYSNPTLARSLHPSESSSFRYFVDCARSVRSFRSQISRSTYSSFRRHLYRTRGLSRSLLLATDNLSDSFRSMSLKESDDGLESFEEEKHVLEEVTEEDEEDFDDRDDSN
jgi:hypothetical protein